jgi:predicted DNA-binding transcriptional regulator YafY
VQSDRLLSLLFLLEAGGRQSARALAGELEVSKRTIYRDIDALSAAGVPVYAERGRNGGCELLPGYRTDLTGLTVSEARALFVFAGRAGPSQLGLESDLRSAFRKLLAGLPERQRPEAVRAQERVVIDPTGWMKADDESPLLGRVQEAIWSDRRLRIRYRSADAIAGREAVVDPYGLVAKAGVWYMIAAIDGEPRLYRVSRIEGVDVLDEASNRPADLDLEALWLELRRRFEDRGSGTVVTVRVRPDTVQLFRRLMGTRGVELTEPPADHPPEGSAGAWVSMTFRFPAEGAAVGAILGLGASVEVIEPPAIRAALLRAARELASLYGSGS